MCGRTVPGTVYSRNLLPRQAFVLLQLGFLTGAGRSDARLQLFACLLAVCESVTAVCDPLVQWRLNSES